MTDIFQDRERGFEAGYFRNQDQKLMAKIRERSSLADVAKALADKLHIDNAELLRRVTALGVTGETGAAMLALPLVQVAWAEGNVSAAERKTVLSIVEGRGIAPGSPAYKQLETWLTARPSDALFDTALAALRDGMAVLPPAEREERIKYLVAAAHKVAEASGGGLLKHLHLASGVSHSEEAVLEAISRKLRADSK